MKQTMKVGMVLLGALTIAMWFGISSVSKKKEVLTNQYTELEAEIMQKELAFNDILTLYDKVEGQIGDILERERLVQQHNADQLDKRNPQKIFKQISMIDDLIFRSKQDLRQLEDEAKSANLKLGLFEKRIAGLQAELSTRSETIASLKEELSKKDESLAKLIVEQDSLHSTIHAQLENLEQRSLEVKQLTAQNNELNKSYLAIGTYEDLKAKGVVMKEGGFLGLFGKAWKLQEEADEAAFMTVDRRNLQRLRIEASMLDLVSSHPEGSYQILPGESEAEKVLEITDPERFWKVSKYLVISKKI
ncbi:MULTISPECIES: hypothetical protein [Roseivirga]|jgi:chromosome segregation ATPase|nr:MULTISPECIES: hypothetical protein [Roseivirga]MEC7754431.1 hypothetical protein [Bacteroidota bacterium]|tara:strand:- start:9506 stop:10417 length:912 start_codon:yes stop_codon:yes gene_type:complete